MATSGSSTSQPHPQPHPQPRPPAPQVKTPVVRVNPANVAKGAAPANAPAAAAAVPEKAPLNPKLLYGTIAGGALLVVIVALLVWRPWKTEPPRLNEEPWKIAKFVASPEFKKLPFERQFTYMDVLDDKEPAIAQAYKEKKLNDEEYAAALQGAYLGKHLKRAKNYAEKGTARAREMYLDKLIEKKKKGGSDKGKTKGTEPLDADEIKRDDTEEQETISKWPAEAQAQWTAYRMALKSRKEALKEEKADRKAAATQAAATQRAGGAATKSSATAPQRDDK
jgi:hypothetical protein